MYLDKLVQMPDLRCNMEMFKTIYEVYSDIVTIYGDQLR